MENKTRKFPCSDARFLEFASTVVSFLPDDIADFTAFDSSFGQNTIDSLQAAITAALETKPDYVVVGEMAELTEIVEQQMATCREAYKILAYFVQKTFKTKKDIQEEFGLKKYRKARNKKELMIVFMRSLAESTAKYRSDLISGGMNENDINPLATIHQTLFDAKNNQEQYKKRRVKFTAERLEKMNLLFDELNPIGKAARIIYKNDKARLGKYVLGRTRLRRKKELDL